MKEIIKLAIEGGYKQDWPNARKGYVEIDQALLDPLFWQSLGKALGWKDPKDESKWPLGYIPWWLQHWHYFIDHLADGKEAEEFFTSLIK